MDEKEVKELLVEVDRLRKQVTHLQTHNSELVETGRSEKARLENELTLEKLQVQACGSMMLEMQQQSITLSQELDRFKRGEVTAEEAHALCHGLSDSVSAQEFAEGCRLYQIRLYGHAPQAKNFIPCVCTESLPEDAGAIRKIADPCQWCGGVRFLTPEIKKLVLTFESGLYIESIP